MYLKRIEITGFKSFADKTIIEFEDDVTAVVGPNGSGKSNITEAVRWVLGEHLRKPSRWQNERHYLCRFEVVSRQYCGSYRDVRQQRPLFSIGL